MSQMMKDLTKPGQRDEPKESSNAGLKLALIATAVLVFLCIIMFVSAPKVHMNRQASQNLHVGMKTVPVGDTKSYADGQAVQSDAITGGAGNLLH